MDLFGTKGISLSGNVGVTRENDKEWKITDKEKGNAYIIREEGEELNIYTTATTNASESSVKNESKGTFGSLLYVMIGMGIGIASLFLSAKFSSSRGGQKQKVRKEGGGGKTSEKEPGMQKGTRKEW